MYSTCPKCSHQRQPGEKGDTGSCPSCGLVYSKWLKSLAAGSPEELVELPASPGSSLANKALALLLPAREPVPPAELLVCGLLLAGLTWWGLDFIAMDFRSNEIGRSFLHNVNLVFHEAGHVIFSPFGRFWMFMGGSLFQVLFPLIFVVAFLYARRDAIGASVCLWWAGQAMMDVAPYIADARALRLPLLGGGTGADSPGSHDWANILRMTGRLNHDITIATWVDLTGSGVIILSIIWGAAAVWAACRLSAD